MKSPIDLECSPTGQRRHLMTRPFTPTSTAQLAGPPATAARLRSRALHYAPAHAGPAAATLRVYVYALVRRTVRSLHAGQRLHLAGPAATLRVYAYVYALVR